MSLVTPVYELLYIILYYNIYYKHGCRARSIRDIHLVSSDIFPKTSAARQAQTTQIGIIFFPETEQTSSFDYSAVVAEVCCAASGATPDCDVKIGRHALDHSSTSPQPGSSSWINVVDDNDDGDKTVRCNDEIGRRPFCRYYHWILPNAIMAEKCMASSYCLISAASSIILSLYQANVTSRAIQQKF
ncbi:hypothetical protein F2P81_014062 [Scophthalmus maximus]|uniref:Uncharacterized protein n=1 Tax=Scophthalmus maximus TaxID=52904 RepID=A0A6A4SFR7_SCOMX|nr:hypothetical protein F2P81_014062 [Scophthalmus maximus]